MARTSRSVGLSAAAYLAGHRAALELRFQDDPLRAAELDAEHKNRISHRGIALQKLIGLLRDQT